MNNRRTIYGLAAFCVAAILLAGCIPEDSLQWSQDGAVGLLRVQGALYLVDGQTGALTEIAKENVQPWPDISKDGNLIAYGEAVEIPNLSQGLKLLPPGQVKMIEFYAGQVKKSVFDAGGLTDAGFPFPEKGPLTPHDYRNWAIRCLCENADDKLSKILGDEGIKKAREMPIHYFQVVVAPRKAPDKKNIVAANLFSMVAPKLSPTGKHVAYLMHTQEGEVSNAYEEHALCVASLNGDVKAVLVENRVAFGYDWNKDGRTIAYLDADSKNLRNDDLILGTLKERTVADADGGLFATPSVPPEQGTAWTHECTGQTASLAGAIFYPWLKVQYGPGGRIFFSSCLLSLPASERDEPRWSLFCYDSVTATVTDVLPLNVSNHTGQAMTMAQFALSPDGKSVLLPIKNNRFVCYGLGTDSIEIPIKEDEGFGEEEVSELVPSWKGNDEVSFLVAENSHFLPKAEECAAAASRKEIIVLRKTDGTSRVLSESWPDETEPGSEDGQQKEEPK
jgi:hypothetical protein